MKKKCFAPYVLLPYFENLPRNLKVTSINKPRRPLEFSPNTFPSWPGSLHLTQHLPRVMAVNRCRQ